MKNEIMRTTIDLPRSLNQVWKITSLAYDLSKNKFMVQLLKETLPSYIESAEANGDGDPDLLKAAKRLLSKNCDEGEGDK